MKKVLFILGIIYTSFGFSQGLKNDTSGIPDLTSSKDIWLNISSDGWCESTTNEGEWKDCEEQYILAIGHSGHKWVYSEKDIDEWFGYQYACVNCCPYPDYDITQKRICELCGLLQIKKDRVEHEWVFPPKSRFEQIIDSLKSKI